MKIYKSCGNSQILTGTRYINQIRVNQTKINDLSRFWSHQETSTEIVSISETTHETQINQQQTTKPRCLQTNNKSATLCVNHTKQTAGQQFTIATLESVAVE